MISEIAPIPHNTATIRTPKANSQKFFHMQYPIAPTVNIAQIKAHGFIFKTLPTKQKTVYEEFEL